MSIHWHKWEKPTFDRAKKLDKPILLDISAVWCHWCHVMDETTYSDLEVARSIMENCVPVRVDRDQRPDIDRRYNMGGWPTTVFLTPNGKIITGGTYIPPRQMENLVKQIADYYKKNKLEIEAEAARLEKKAAVFKPAIQLTEKEDFQSVIDNVILNISGSFDQTYGGFGSAPKFPHSDAVSFALLEYRLQGHKALLNIATKTLKAMQNGGICDKVEGGFFRYSTTRDWSVPHYEKMCEDNAKLLGTYLQAYQVTTDESFKATAQQIMTYVDRNLSDHENGGFYGSQDADEEYYKLTRAERDKRAKPNVDTTLFTNYNAMMISSYLLASAVLENEMHEKFALKTIDRLLEQCWNANEGMCHFISDGKPHLSMLLTDQVHMAKALIDCYQFTADRRLLSRAESIMGLMIRNLWSDETGFLDRPVKDDDVGILKTPSSPFDENAIAAESLLRLYHLTGNQTYSEKALSIMRWLFQVYQNFEVQASSYALVVELYLHPVQVHVIGSHENTLTQQYVQATLKSYNPLKTVEVVDPVRDDERLKALKYPLGEEPAAYVCKGGTCTLADSSNDLARQLELS